MFLRPLGHVASCHWSAWGYTTLLEPDGGPSSWQAYRHMGPHRGATLAHVSVGDSYQCAALGAGGSPNASRDNIWQRRVFAGTRNDSPACVQRSIGTACMLVVRRTSWACSTEGRSMTSARTAEQAMPSMQGLHKVTQLLGDIVPDGHSLEHERVSRRPQSCAPVLRLRSGAAFASLRIVRAGLSIIVSALTSELPAL